MNFLVLTKAGSILGPIATVFGYIMDVLFKFTSSFNCYNLGICIILFTVITKILLFPLTIKQQENTRLMKLMNPEIQAIQKKYKGKTDQTSMARQNAEMLGLMVNDPNLDPADLAGIRAKTLVIAGTRDMIKEEHTKLIADSIPEAELVFLKGDHFVAARHPDAFNRAVLKFLGS